MIINQFTFHAFILIQMSIITGCRVTKWSCFPQVAGAGSPLCDTFFRHHRTQDTGDTAHWITAS